MNYECLNQRETCIIWLRDSQLIKTVEFTDIEAYLYEYRLWDEQ